MTTPLAVAATTVAIAASASSGLEISESLAAVVPSEKLLELCFVIGSLDLAIFGFLFSTYTAYLIQKPPPPPVIGEVVVFCRILVAVLIVLSLIVLYIVATAYRSIQNWPLWIIALCFLGMVGSATFISRKIK